MKKYIFIVILIALVLGVVYGFMLYNKPHRDIAAEKPTFNMSADELLTAFSGDEKQALEKFNGQVIAIHGNLGEVTTSNEGIHYAIIKGQDGLLNCELDGDAFGVIQNLDKNTTVTLKGLFVGYDELLGEIQFKKCTLTK